MRRQASLETNLCRKGLWSSAPAQLELPLEAQDLLGLVRSSGRLKVSPDLEVLAWLTERWREQRPEGGWLRFTIYQLGKDLYGRKPSGADVKGLRAALVRLKMVTVTLVGYDSQRGETNAKVASLDNLIDRIATELDDLGRDASPEAIGGLRGSTFSAQLPPWLISQLAAGSITYLDWAILRQLDGLAKRLWVYLMAERYKLNGHGSELTWIKLGDRAYTSLGMNYAQDRQARAALKRAGVSICANDPRFETVSVERRPGGWAVIAVRTGRNIEQGLIRRQIKKSLNA